MEKPLLNWIYKKGYTHFLPYILHEQQTNSTQVWTQILLTQDRGLDTSSKD